MAVIIEGKTSRRLSPAGSAPLTFAMTAFLMNLAISLPTLGRQAFWGDETLTAQAVDMDVPALVADRLGAGHFPTYFLLLKGLGLAHASDALMRLPSALFEAGAAAVFTVIALSIGGRIAAVATAVLFALVPLLFFYAQEARPYALMLLFLAIATAAHLRIIAGRIEQGRPGLVATIGCVGAALVIPAGIVSVAALHAGLLAAGSMARGRPERRLVLRHLIVTWVAIGLAALALIPNVMTAAQGSRGLMKWQLGMSPGRRLVEAWNEIFGLLVRQDANVFLPAGWEIVPSLGFVALIVTGAWLGRKNTAIRYVTATVVTTAVGFVVIGSFTVTAGRYLLGILPPAILLASFASARLLAPGRFRLPAAAMLAALAGAMALQTLDASISDTRYNWRRPADFIAANDLGHAEILTNMPFYEPTLRRYLPANMAPTLRAPLPPIEPPGIIWQWSRETPNAYVLAFDGDATPPPEAVAGRTVCSWAFGRATFFVLAADMTTLPAPLRGCAGN